MTLLGQLGTTALAGLRDLLPIIIILLAFQVLFLRRLPADWKRMGLGIVYVFVGLTLFTVGLEEALFPLGELMARQLTAPVPSSEPSSTKMNSCSNAPCWRCREEQTASR